MYSQYHYFEEIYHWSKRFTSIIALKRCTVSLVKEVYQCYCFEEVYQIVGELNLYRVIESVGRGCEPGRDK